MFQHYSHCNSCENSDFTLVSLIYALRAFHSKSSFLSTSDSVTVSYTHEQH